MWYAVLPEPQKTEREGCMVEKTCDEMLFVLAMVGSREREVLRMRYGLDGFPPCSWVEVAEAFGISPQSAYGVERKALKRAQAALS
jgi:DNA-directed RNA polymerase sigma subunit (sigma70/sigma32)